MMRRHSVKGHDYSPMLFTVVNGNLKFVCKLDVPPSQKASSVNTAFKMFKNIDKNATSEAIDVTLKTLHQNMIT